VYKHLKLVSDNYTQKKRCHSTHEKPCSHRFKLCYFSRNYARL